MQSAIETIKETTADIEADNSWRRKNMKAKALEFAAIADAGECLELINELIERVSSITGEAGNLENAACVLIRHIDNEVE